MPLTSEFTCPDGHKFTAIAKIRSRCPTCGKSSRRNFQVPEKPESQSVSPGNVTKPEEPVKPSPTISPASFSKVEKRKDTGNGSKPDSITTKVPESKSVTKPTAKSPQIIKQGLMPKPTTASVKKTAPATKPAKGPVKRVSAKSGVSPKVTKPPVGSKERKVVEQVTDDRPFWEKVKNQYFR